MTLKTATDGARDDGEKVHDERLDVGDGVEAEVASPPSKKVRVDYTDADSEGERRLVKELEEVMDMEEID